MQATFVITKNSNHLVPRKRILHDRLAQNSEICDTRSLSARRLSVPAIALTYRNNSMKLKDKTIVVTGGARGIGKALCAAFAREGARVVVTDLLTEEAEATAKEIDGIAMTCDVSKEIHIQQVVAATEQQVGPIDLFCSNAGICTGEPGNSASASNADWQACWDLHVMAHVYAARAVLPSMIERGEGYFVQMASAAGLLSQIGDAAYSASKHAAIGFAESLSITHADEGIKVSVICPQYVATPMLGYAEGEGIGQYDGVISPVQVADSVVRGIDSENFLILPHPEVEGFIKFKTANYDRWLGGMRKLRRNILIKIGNTRLQDMHKLV
ncbi:MAG: NAD(P)-dependent dehydrogenase (short-subunit alcohol dehydrogenase family) [Parasphingorhabdus sp.]